MEEAQKKDIILVPTDFTEAADTAINHAAQIARQRQDELLLLHIINAETRSILKKEKKTTDWLSQRLQQKAQDIEKEYGIEARYQLREGSIFSQIGEVAEDSNARLLVIGTHGVLGVQHITGAYVVKVASTSPVPVIIVQKRPIGAEGYRRIILPVNHTKENRQLALQAMNISQMFGGHIYLYVAHSTDALVQEATRMNADNIIRLLEENSLPYTRADEDVRGKGFARKLIRYAGEVQADLIAIMNEKGGNFSEFVVGPDNEKIINNEYQVAVMCLNPIENIIVYGQSLAQYGERD